jgi:hypothetical protein
VTDAAVSPMYSPAYDLVRERFAVSITPRYASITSWGLLSGQGRSATYEALGQGHLRAIKLGSRTLIDVEHGLAWLASMPAAKITTGRKRGRLSLEEPEPRPPREVSHDTRVGVRE